MIGFQTAGRVSETSSRLNDLVDSKPYSQSDSNTGKAVTITLKRYFSYLLILLGIVFVFYGLSYKVAELYLETQSYELVPIIADNELLQGSWDEGKTPANIKIDELAMDLEVKPAQVFNGEWEVFNDVSAYGLGSGLPGEPGNIVIFAHARWGLFFPLKNAKEEMRIEVTTKDGTAYEYIVSEIKSVKPSDVEVIKPTEDETLTLYTCSGFNDEKRLIVVAKRI